MKFKAGEAKQIVISDKKKKTISCDIFNGPCSAADEPKWGTSEDVIFFTDHITSISSKLNREAKKLHASKKVEHVWTMNETTFVRKAAGEKFVQTNSYGDTQMVANGGLRRSRRRKLLSPKKIQPDSKRDQTSSVK